MATNFLVGDKLIFNADLEHGNQRDLNMFRSWRKALTGTFWTVTEREENYLKVVPDDNRVGCEYLGPSAFPVFKLVGGDRHGE